MLDRVVNTPRSSSNRAIRRYPCPSACQRRMSIKSACGNKSLGEGRGALEVAEHHRELAALGFRGNNGGGHRGRRFGLLGR